MWCKFDKSTLIHIGICFIITLCIGISMYYIFNISIIPSAVSGVVSAFLCGLGKEFADYSNPNSRWNWGDIIGNFIGCILAFILLIVIWI